MQWTPVDLATIARILDDLSEGAFVDDIPDRIYAMLERAHFLETSRTPTRRPSTPTPRACSRAYCASASPVADPALALTACLQYPLPDPTHGG